MATPKLQSASLYRVANLGPALEALNFETTAAGWERLRDVHFRVRSGIPRFATAKVPSSKTVGNMLYNGEFAKHITCREIQGAMECVAEANKTPLPPDVLIEEHEFVIVNIGKAIESISTRHKISRIDAVKEVAASANQHSGLVRAMDKGFRTSRDRCTLVLEAIKTIISASNSDAAVLQKLRIEAALAKAQRAAVSDQMMLDLALP